MNSSKKHVGIIGGGPGGIGTAKSLLEDGHEVTVFEASQALGGLWRYDETRKGGVYKTTMYQTTKFISSFCDFPFDDSVSSFPVHDEFLAYLEKYARHFGIEDRFRYGHRVESARPIGDRWELTVVHDDLRQVLEFDAIAVCTGQYWKPSVPRIPGQDGFGGKVIHAVDYKENGVFKDQRVVVVGAGVTGMDLAVEASKVAKRAIWSVKGKNWLKPRWLGFVPYEAGVAEGVHLSREQLLENWRRWIPDFHDKAEKHDLIPDREPFREGFLANDEILNRLESGLVEKRCRIESFGSDSVRFEDGSEEQVDIVALATGYDGFHFPFFDADILGKLAIHDEGMDLFQHVFHPQLANCAFIFHVTGNAPALPTIELQSRWFSMVLSGAKSLPEPREMADRIAAEKSRRRVELNPRPYRSNFVDTTYLMQLANTIGVLPDRTLDWNAYLDLVKPPSFPPIFRMYGHGRWDKAGETISRLRDKYPIKIAVTKEWKLQVLKTNSQAELLKLYQNKQITREEVRGAWPAEPVGAPPAAAGRGAPAPSPDIGGRREPENLERRLVAELKAVLFETMKIAPEDVDENQDMSQYGFNSISLGRFASALRTRFAIDAPPSSFFEHTTISSYAKYMLAAFGQDVSKHFAESQAAPPRRKTPAAPATSPDPSRDRGVVGSPASVEDIAVIGMHVRFPGARTPDDFWRNLDSGADSIAPAPLERFDWKRLEADPRYRNAKSLLGKGGFLEDIDKFDAEFFAISEREASLMDPQQRILLQSIWHVVEDAGYAMSDLSKAVVGTFVGGSSLDFNEVIFAAGAGVDINAISGGSYCMLANRMSFLLNLTGPSETVDTACSSSLVAIHRAIQSLRDGDCSVAIAGGVNLLISPGRTLGLTLSGMLSKDGRTCSFGGEASGFVRGEGVGTVLLKPLSRALRDNDRIHGVIKGSAVNHNGRANSIYAPNPVSQSRVIENAIRKSGVPAWSISYVEAQGTGNKLGDSLEFGALGGALANSMDESRRGRFHCRIGSVKSNIGNLEAASGMASLAKVLLSMRHRRIPASLHSRIANPDLPDSGLDLRVAAESLAWDDLLEGEAKSLPLRAGISAFGIGGANAHLVVEEFRKPIPVDEITSVPPIFALSAKNRHRLLEYVALVKSELEARRADITLDQVLQALQVGREQMKERIAFVCHGYGDLVRTLERVLEPVAGQTAVAGVYGGGAVESKQLAGVLNQTSETAAYIEALFAGGKHEEIARLWAAGVHVDWRSLSRIPGILKISMPGYPFQSKRHWIEPPQGAVVAIDSSVEVAAQA